MMLESVEVADELSPADSDFTQIIAQFVEEPLQAVSPDNDASIDMQAEVIIITDADSLTTTEPPLIAAGEYVSDEIEDQSDTDESMVDAIETIALPWINMVSYTSVEAPPVLSPAVSGVPNQILKSSDNISDNPQIDNNSLSTEPLITTESEEVILKSVTDDTLQQETLQFAQELSHFESEIKPFAAELIPATSTLAAPNETNNVTPSTPVKNLDIMRPITDPEWGYQFNQQVLWLGQQQIDKAVIRIHPEELGPLEVKLQLADESIRLTIHTNNQPVSHLLEQTMPRLREMMLEQGVTLSQVTIETNTEASSQQRSYQQEKNNSESLENTSNEQEILQSVKASEGLIDYFA